MPLVCCSPPSFFRHRKPRSLDMTATLNLTNRDDPTIPTCPVHATPCTGMTLARLPQAEESYTLIPLIGQKPYIHEQLFWLCMSSTPQAGELRKQEQPLEATRLLLE
eukprot:2492271-Pleurochrysis_carterae.AAC.3